MKIYGDKQYLYQWDINQKVVVERLSAGDEVHYVISDDEVLVCSVYESNGLMMADIPNIILQSSGLIKTYEVKRADDGTNINTYRSAIRILERPCPTDYIYTETDTKNFHILSRQIDVAKETVVDFGKRLERVENLDHRLESLGIEVNEVLDGFEDYLENSLSQIEDTLNTEYLPAISKAQSTADSKLDKINPIGIGNLSMNRKSNSTVGSYSVAVGRDTEAAGESSLTEGQDTYAWGQAAHAEGYGTAALNMAAHAEGNDTVASGDYGAHAEGFMTTASGNDAHSQGYKTTASGQGSHAQGRETIASGRYAHSEGYGTDAASDMQHTQGRYNVRDAEHTYAHIVGNGTSDTKRSNAHTLDWDGNGWYQGTIKVGGTGQDDPNAKDVALKEDIPSLPQTSATDVGKLLQVAEDGSWVLGEAEDPITEEEINQMNLISIEDIDEICGMNN